MSDNLQEQLLKELSDVQRMLEQRNETQGNMIRKFQELISNGSIFTKIIDYFPYPMAIFTPQYTLPIVNKAFAEETELKLGHDEQEEVRILRYKTSDMQLAAAVTNVFDGKTYILEDLKDPFSIFAGIERREKKQSRCFAKAVIFPVLSGDGAITHGVIVIMP
ncbi:MAG: hypothetical protein GX193_06545 [Clostridiales bacterium]|nr:hypothetical protein [Clostridiales bacterium]